MKDLLTVIMGMLLLPLWAQNDLVSQRQAFADSYGYEYRGSYDSAIQVLQSVHSSQSYETNLRLGWLQYLAGNYPESEKLYAQARRLLPFSIEAKLGHALPLSAMGNWNEVYSTYEEILKIDPNHSLTLYRLGLIHYERKEYEKAFHYLEKVVNRYPFDYDSVVLFAWTQFQMGRLREAKVLFSKALLINPYSESAAEGLKLIK